MATAKIETSRFRLPILDNLLCADKSHALGDIIAGVTLASLAIPECMGYTKIAGTPVITGLYTILIPMVLFAVFGSSRHLVVGADSATAAILAAGLAGLHFSGSGEYLGLCGVLAIMAAVLLLFARIIRLGFLADFLSRTVLVGFLTGVGIQVAAGQLPGMLNLPKGGEGVLGGLIHDIRCIDLTNPYALALALGTLLIIIGGNGFSKRIPGALIAVIVSIPLSWRFNLHSYGVDILGPAPSGLPAIHLPDVSLSFDLLRKLLPTAFSMAIVILAQSAATSRAYAMRYNETFSENMDLIGLGLANIGAGLSGTFVVNGSPTKTQMVDSAGGRSQLAHLTTSVIVLFVLLFLTGPLGYLPNAVLSAVVFMIGVDLIDLEGLRRIYAERRVEFFLAVLTVLTVVFVGVEQAIVLAMLLSLMIHTRHGYRPKNALLVKDDNAGWRELPVAAKVQIAPGLMVYRFTHGIYYANAEQLSQEVTALVEGAQPPLCWFCIDAVSVDDIDFTAAEALRSLCLSLKSQGIRVVMCQVTPDVRLELDRSEITEVIGARSYFATVNEVIGFYHVEK